MSGAFLAQLIIAHGPEIAEDIYNIWHKKEVPPEEAQALFNRIKARTEAQRVDEVRKASA